MRIGIDCRLWNESGVGRYIRNLVAELAKIDKDNQYVLFFRTREFTHLEVPGKNFEKKLADIRWHSIEEQLKLPSILNKEKLDLIHFPYFSVPIFYKKPYVVTVHDLILDHFPTGQASTLWLPVYKLKLLAYTFIISKAARDAKKIITVSKATKKEIIDHFGVNEDKIVVTYEGIDEKIRNQESGIRNQNKPYFLYVGNAYPHKNLDRLLEAFQIICHQNNIQLIMVGKEDFFYKKLKRTVYKMNLKEQVIFKGEVTDKELSSLYRNTRALVMPSLMEGFGLPIIEAMANKCLVVASHIAVHREIGEDAVLFFDPYNVNEMVKTMSIICSIDSNHRSKLIEKGLKRAHMFSWEKMGKETLKVYEGSSGIRPR